jgi:DNA-binding NarL/FixJ family response regulator
METIRVVVADDGADFVLAMTQVLAADSRFIVVGTVDNGSDLVSLVEATVPDLVLIDVRMPTGGVAAVRSLRAAAAAAGTGGRDPRIVVMTAQSTVETVLSLLREGVVGYLAKGRIGSDLPDLLARTAAGEVVFAVPTGADALRLLLREIS